MIFCTAWSQKLIQLINEQYIFFFQAKKSVRTCSEHRTIPESAGGFFMTEIAVARVSVSMLSRSVLRRMMLWPPLKDTKIRPWPPL